MKKMLLALFILGACGARAPVNPLIIPPELRVAPVSAEAVE